MPSLKELVKPTKQLEVPSILSSKFISIEEIFWDISK
jgi:hypothetical protein